MLYLVRYFRSVESKYLQQLNPSLPTSDPSLRGNDMLTPSLSQALQFQLIPTSPCITVADSIHQTSVHLIMSDPLLSYSNMTQLTNADACAAQKKTNRNYPFVNGKVLAIHIFGCNLQGLSRNKRVDSQ